MRKAAKWGNLLNEENPHQLQQLIRLPGQQYDEESGLYYNRHRALSEHKTLSISWSHYPCSSLVFPKGCKK
ncbi:hypothetical protein LGS58_21885 [Escherichia coli]|nr:hypothetical protein [Escherichia coli]UCT05401.1 hypothetical protein LGS58_21885 [Escherichia coli]